jgi:hypothetical protein
MINRMSQNIARLLMGAAAGIAFVLACDRGPSSSSAATTCSIDGPVSISPTKRYCADLGPAFELTQIRNENYAREICSPSPQLAESSHDDQIPRRAIGRPGVGIDGRDGQAGMAEGLLLAALLGCGGSDQEEQNENAFPACVKDVVEQIENAPVTSPPASVTGFLIFVAWSLLPGWGILLMQLPPWIATS